MGLLFSRYCSECLTNTLLCFAWLTVLFCNDQIRSFSVISDSLRPHESQHARPLCPSPTPGVHWDSRPSSQWCHKAISSSVVPFSSCPQSLPASKSFPMSQLFAWVGLWRRLSAEELMLLNCGVGEASWESLGLQGDLTSPFWRRSALRFLCKEWC